MEILKKIIGSKFALFFLILGIIWMALVSVKAYWRQGQLDGEIAALKANIEKINKGNAQLEQQIKYFDNPNYLAREAKDKLNLQSAGETVVMIPQNVVSAQLSATSSVAASPLPTATSNPAPESNLAKWWEYMFGH